MMRPRGYERGPRPSAMMRPREYERAPGPSPWVPALFLGIILLIAAMPYMRTPDPTVAYQVARKTPSIPYPLLWIPVICVIAWQFFGGNRQFAYDRYGRPVMGRGAGGMYAAGPGGRYGDVRYAGAPGGLGMYSSRGIGPYRAGPEYNNRGGWGDWWSNASWNPYNRNNYNEKGLMSYFMDFGGHWLLIVLGIALFTLVGSSSAPAV